jgi:hypothetical protein
MRLQRTVLRMGQHLHGPPAGRCRCRPAHLQSPHHPNRHQQLPAQCQPQQERSRQHLTDPKGGAKSGQHSGAKSTCHSHDVLNHDNGCLGGPIQGLMMPRWRLDPGVRLDSAGGRRAGKSPHPRLSRARRAHACASPAHSNVRASSNGIRAVTPPGRNLTSARGSARPGQPSRLAGANARRRGRGGRRHRAL